MKLVKNTPVGTRNSFTHLHMKSKPHEWREVAWDVYSKEDVARGERFRKARREAGVGIGEMADRLRISPARISDLECGRSRPADEIEEAKFFNALKEVGSR